MKVSEQLGFIRNVCKDFILIIDSIKYPFNCSAGIITNNMIHTSLNSLH